MSKHPTTDGRFTIRWRDEEKVHRSKTFDLEADADAWQDQVRRLKQTGQLHRLTSGTITLSQFVADTVVPEYFALLAPKTRKWYAYLLSCHILPELGLIPLRSITAKRIRQWQVKRAKSGAGKYALNRALVLIGQILQYAAEDDELETNVAANVRPLKLDPVDGVVPLAPLTIERIRSHLDETRDRAIVALLAYAGMRPGEIWALRWGDIKQRTIHVQIATDGEGGTKPTKTLAKRSIKILGPLADDLQAWRRETTGSTAARARVFPAATSTRVATKDTMDNWRDRDVWAPAMRRAGVEYQRPYDLRHSFASLLLAEGRTIHAVARQLGHDPKLTLSTYGHVIAEFEDMPSIDAVEQILAARKAIDELPDLVVVPTDVDCSRCGAYRGAHCTAPAGRIRDTDPHVVRIRDARRAATLKRFKHLETTV